MEIQFPAIIIFVLIFGIIIGRFSFSKRQSKSKTDFVISNCSETYIQGLNYLLANKSDKAIQLFVDLIKVDGETIETHLALGNLFRSKGEVDRAIKIHQNLIARPNLESKQRIMALSELAEDYLKAGLLDRAENLYKELVQIDPGNISAQKKLLELFTIEKSWNDALSVAKKLTDLGVTESRLIVTHCYCEIAEQLLISGNLREARENLNKAIQIDEKCIRASLLLIEVHLKNDELNKASRLLKQLLKIYPQFMELFLKPARDIFLKRGSAENYQSFLKEQYEKTPVAKVAIELLESYQSGDQHEALENFLKHAIYKSTSLELYDFVFQYYNNRPRQISEIWQELAPPFNQIKDKRVSFLCNVCGYESHAMQWQCPSCKSWSSLHPLQS